MFAHILTDVDDEQLVKTQWESFTGESLSSYSVSVKPLSQLTPASTFIELIARRGRKYKQLLWIKADVEPQSLPALVVKALEVNVVLVTKDGAVPFKCSY